MSRRQAWKIAGSLAIFSMLGLTMLCLQGTPERPGTSEVTRGPKIRRGAYPMPEGTGASVQGRVLAAR